MIPEALTSNRLTLQGSLDDTPDELSRKVVAVEAMSAVGFEPGKPAEVAKAQYEHHDVIVIGQGYAGLTAAKLALNQGSKVANFEAECMGGLVVNLNDLDPVPEGVSHAGFELASDLAEKNGELGVTPVADTVVAVEAAGDGLWLVRTASTTYSATNVIVASGARLRRLGVAGEQEFFGRGVSECADCDGPMFKGMEVIVVGGGDSAFQEAIVLAEYATKVTLVMRGEGPRAKPIWLERAAKLPNINHLTQTRVLAINGAEGGVESVTINTMGKGESTLPCAGVFIFIGLDPNTAFLPADLARDPAGALITNAYCATAQPGLWAIGAVRSGFPGLLTDAASDAQQALAAISAAQAAVAAQR